MPENMKSGGDEDVGLDQAERVALAERLGEVCEDGFVVEPWTVTLAIEDVERLLAERS